jgi:hypothetical protein
MLAYKLLVRENSGGLVSYAISNYPGSRYCLWYKENEITEAIKESLGVFCFKSIEDILKSMYRWGCSLGNKVDAVLHEVDGMGAPVIPNLVSLYIRDNNLTSFYRKLYGTMLIPEEGTVIPPEHGTICFPKVMVGKDITEKYLKRLDVYNSTN